MKPQNAKQPTLVGFWVVCSLHSLTFTSLLPFIKISTVSILTPFLYVCIFTTLLFFTVEETSQGETERERGKKIKEGSFSSL